MLYESAAVICMTQAAKTMGARGRSDRPFGANEARTTLASHRPRRGDDYHRSVETRLPPTVTSMTGAELAAAYPWPPEPWVRVAMLRTLDGGVAGADGRSRSISSDVDRAVLAEIRRLSDAIVSGAGTIRTEPYGPMLARPDAAAERRDLGLAPAPVIVVVSGSLDLPWDAPMFTASSHRPIVVTTSVSAAEDRRRAAQVCDLVVVDDDRVRPTTLVAALKDRGLRRLVVEGGPGLVASLTAADVVDEVDLTLSPMLGASSPSAHAASTLLARFELRHCLADAGFLFTRYVNARGVADEPAH